MSYLTIGGLRDALASLDEQSAEVYIDNRQPTALSSYRGYYDDLAIERSDDAQHERTEADDRPEPFEMNMAGYGTYHTGISEVRVKSPATVADLVEALDLANGKTFEGYKGGQYTMRSSTEIWVSEYGEVSRLRVDRVESLPGRVDLWTVEESSW